MGPSASCNGRASMVGFTGSMGPPKSKQRNFNQLSPEDTYVDIDLPAGITPDYQLFVVPSRTMGNLGELDVYYIDNATKARIKFLINGQSTTFGNWMVVNGNSKYNNLQSDTEDWVFSVTLVLLNAPPIGEYAYYIPYSRAINDKINVDQQGKYSIDGKYITSGEILESVGALKIPTYRNIFSFHLTPNGITNVDTSGSEAITSIVGDTTGFTIHFNVDLTDPHVFFNVDRMSVENPYLLFETQVINSRTVRINTGRSIPWSDLIKPDTIYHVTAMYMEPKSG